MKQLLPSNKLLTGLFVSAFGLGAYAQPTLNAGNNATIAGESQTYYIADSNAVDYASTTGAGVTWDYSSLWMYGQTADNDVTASSNTDFPSSAISDNLENSLDIYRNNYADSIVAQGYVLTIPGMGNATVTLTDELRLMEYPFTYGNSFTDDLDGEASVAISPFPVPYSGSIVVEADGYGTLELGTTTFNNVLRVKVSETSSADATLLGAGVIPIIRTQYFYYEPGTSKFPVLMYVTMDINGTVSSAVYSSISLPANNIEENTLSAFNLSPNPANNMVNINVSSETSSSAQMNILSSVGQVISSENVQLNKGNNVIRKNLDGLSSGIYFVRISKGTQNITKKLMVK